MRSLILSLFVFGAAIYFTASSASSQILGLIQNDYERYAQLFKAGRDPNMSHHPTEGSARWRALYRNHHWKDYAEETEFRDPLRAAQVLMSIYLIYYVDHELTYQIDSIVLHKAHFSNALAEYVTLNRIHTYMEATKNENTAGAGGRAMAVPGGPDGDAGGGSPDAGRAGSASAADEYYSPAELDRMERLGRNIHEDARRRMVAGRQITRRQNAEVRSVENLFHQEEKGWGAMYASMREKINILDDLSDSFTFNWDETRREEELQKLLEDPSVLRLADERTRNLRAAPVIPVMQDPMMMDGGMGMDDGMGDGGMGMDGGMGGQQQMSGRTAPGLTEQQIEEIKAQMPRNIADEMIKKKELQHTAFKYIVGVYQGTEYHLQTLRTIRRYLQTAADQGDPIAQFHLGLFLKYLGEVMGMDPEEAEEKSKEWLTKAAKLEITAERVEELMTFFEIEADNADKTEQNKAKKLEALMRLETEKMAMIEEVLKIVVEKIGDIDTTSGGGNNNNSGNDNNNGNRNNNRNNNRNQN